MVARFEAQADMALQFGADAVFAHEPRLPSSRSWPTGRVPSCTSRCDGLPVAHPGRIDVVYDSIAKAETLEVGVRVLAERGRLVYTGVATPERWESTPIYFKEITIAGSNAFGMEDFEGRRLHAIAHYLELVADGRLDITPMLTHRFALEEWWPALKALARQEQQRRAQDRLHAQRVAVARTLQAPGPSSHEAARSVPRRPAAQAGSGSIVRPTAGPARPSRPARTPSPAARRAK